jgi:hypothetical protein
MSTDRYDSMLQSHKEVHPLKRNDHTSSFSIQTLSPFEVLGTSKSERQIKQDLINETDE